MHLPLDLTHPLLGFIGSGLATVGVYAADAIPAPDAIKPWLEGGAYVALVTCLIYAVVSLWKRLNDRDQNIAALNQEIRNDWKSQNDKLIQVLEKLDK